MQPIGLLGRTLVLVGVMLPCRAHSGDCLAHPDVMLEIKVLSCAPLDENNARRIGPWQHDTNTLVTPEQARVLAAYRGLVIEAKTLRVRKIYVKQESDRPVGPQPWSVAPGATSYLFYPIAAKKGESATLDARACQRFKRDAVLMVEQHTDCECDTGLCFPGEDVTVRDVFKGDKQYAH